MNKYMYTYDEFQEELADTYGDDGVDRSNFFPVYCHGRGFFIAAATDLCLHCDALLHPSELLLGRVAWHRVNGDSKYGYEPLCERCQAKFSMERDVMTIKDMISILQDMQLATEQLLTNAPLGEDEQSRLDPTDAAARRVLRRVIDHFDQNVRDEYYASLDRVLEEELDRKFGLPNIPLSVVPEMTEDEQAEFDHGFNDFTEM